MTAESKLANDDLDALEALESEAKEFNKVSLGGGMMFSAHKLTVTVYRMQKLTES